MKGNFTQTLLLKKIYNELDENETRLLNEALQDNWELKAELEDLQEVARELSLVKFSPSETSVKLIMQHSRKTAPVVTSC